jgi:U2 small nuclear ribonucleoprotein A'
LVYSGPPPQDQYDTLDLSDNEIKKLDNFPRMKRLKTLLLSNNFITRVAPEIGDQIPELESLVLNNNRIVQLSEIDSLSKLAKLTTLSLLENPVVRQEHYRLYVIHKIPSLKSLDFQRIKLEVSVSTSWRVCVAACHHLPVPTAVFVASSQERKEAARLFKTDEGRQLEETVAKQGKMTAAAAAEAVKTAELTDEQKRMAAVGASDCLAADRLDWIAAFRP